VFTDGDWGRWVGEEDVSELAGNVVEASQFAQLIPAARTPLVG